jgi:hypothetical protein
MAEACPHAGTHPDGHIAVSAGKDPSMSIPEPDEFTNRWLAAWNTHDVEAVLRHFTDDVVFCSPVAARVLAGSDGVIVGKDALRAYWTRALGLVPDLRFELLGVYTGVGSIVINYRNQRGGLVNEILLFDDNGLVRQGHGTYLATDERLAGIPG